MSKITIIEAPPFGLNNSWCRCDLPFNEVATYIASAIDLIELVWPDAAPFVLHHINGLYPVAPGPSGSLRSASQRERPNVVAASIHPQHPEDLAESLLHEARHQEFHARYQHGVYFGESGIPLRHPWKSEARPISAIFLAWHAFVAVAELHTRLWIFCAEQPLPASAFRRRAEDTIAQCDQCAIVLAANEVHLYENGLELFAELHASNRRVAVALATP